MATSTGYADGKYRLSFIAYLPVEDPQYIALALIDSPIREAEGSTSAAPMLREVLENIIKYKNILPNEEIPSNKNTIIAGENMPDLVNTTTAYATIALNGMAMDYKCVGNGDRIDRQFPSAGSKVTPGSEIILYLADTGAELAVVPDVTGMSADEAIALIEAADLVAAPFYEAVSVDAYLNLDKQINSTASPTDRSFDEQSTSQSIDEQLSGQLSGQSSESEILNSSDIVATVPSNVYSQMPAANIRVQKGSAVKIKIRLSQLLTDVID
jgi:hypothetical protein